MAPKLRCTNLQKRKLIAYMTSHPNFAKNEYGGPLGFSKQEAQWQKLASMLRDYGPDKPVSAWKITWRDLTRKARKAKAEYNNDVKKIGNTTEAPELRKEDQMILSIMGTESSMENGPPESRIGGENATLPPRECASPATPDPLCAASPSSSPDSSVAASSFVSAIPLPRMTIGRTPSVAPRDTCTSGAIRVVAGSSVSGSSGFQPRLPTPLLVPNAQPAMPSPPHVPPPQPAPPTRPPVRPRQPAMRRRRLRARPSHSVPVMFAALKKDTNAVLKLIHAELVKSNELRREQIELLRDQNCILLANQGPR